MNWSLLVYITIIFILFIYLPIRFSKNLPPFRLIDKLQDEIIKYKHVIFKQPLNISVCHDNLFLFKKAMDNHNIPFMLSEGTALGMYRDGALIEDDDDVDTAIWGKDKDNFVYKVMPELKKAGFTYSHARENFLSFFRKNEKIDVSIIDSGQCEPGRCDCRKLIPHLKKFTKVYINGVDFDIPAQESYYIFLYSSSWRIPKKDKAIHGDRSNK